MFKKIKIKLENKLAQLYPSKDSGESAIDRYMVNWNGRYRSALNPTFYRITSLVLLLPVISLYFLSPASARTSLVLTYLLMISQVLYLGMRSRSRSNTTLTIYILVSQFALIGHAVSFRLIMNGSLDLENSMIICAMYTTMGFLFIILAPVYNGLALALAMEHLALAYFSWGPSHPDSRTLSWMLILLSFDSFAVGFHILNYQRMRRHAALELSAHELQIQNERLRVESIEKDMRLAQQIQDSLSPKSDTISSGRTTVRFFHRRYDILGGDWMGARMLSNGDLVLAVADVSGKGIAASIVAQAIHTLWVQALVQETFDPEKWLHDVNNTLIMMGHTELHTATIGLAILTEHRVTYYSCGHVPLFLMKKTNNTTEYVPLLSRGNLVGFTNELDLKPVSAAWDQDGTDSILLGTDGIFDRGARTKIAKINDLLKAIEANGSAALNNDDVRDDKLLIWVKRAA